jgi:hypothetical protein
MKMPRLLPLILLAACLALASLPARADGDTIHVGSNIDVPQDAEVSDTVCIFCSVRVEGKVTGDVVVIFGNARIAGDAQHDVVAIFGGITAENNASIEQDVVSVFGSVRLGENVTVGQDLVALFGTLQQAPTVTVGNNTIVKPAWIVWGPLLLVIILVVVIVREYRDYRRRLVLRGYQFPPRT